MKFASVLAAAGLALASMAAFAQEEEKIGRAHV